MWQAGDRVVGLSCCSDQQGRDLVPPDLTSVIHLLLTCTKTHDQVGCRNCITVLERRGRGERRNLHFANSLGLFGGQAYRGDVVKWVR